MSQHTQQHDPQINAELYVLGLLDFAQKNAFEKQMQQDPALQKQVNDFQNQLLAITDQLPTVPLAQPLSAKIERSLDALERQNKAFQPRQKSQSLRYFWQSLSLWRGFALAGFITSLLLSIQLFQYVQQAPGKTTYIAVLVEPQAKSPGWVIQAGNNQKIELIPLGSVEIPEGKALQFWTKADGWNAPISLGLVKKGQSLQVDIDKLPPLQPNQLFELTLEDETGSPTGKPTGPIYSIGRGKPAI
ncbi:DNA-directed RNA polymerase sigma-70 factor [Thiosulfatimonas sediminis]|uniref:DNA-directed RNA polymerase sigma-70 factor n=1 Tax=Thiosulfatimonas sediminis TaxID=2675054 RepID=A0A6F8PRA9_9GAMM|nr:anti-sigma factor [Thiosulfatimonas sediminis]BBP44649.1 DNA-directed RNA polymerase sigma-70 factor [Thiosulfatimonas sediminis]